MTRHDEKDAGLVFALGILLAAALLALADAAHGDELASPTTSPATDCALPADTPQCVTAQPGWQACPKAVFVAAGCEQERLGKALAAAQNALAKANGATQAAANEGAARTSWYKLERDEARRDLEGVRGRALWSWGLGAAGASVAAGGIGVVAGDGSASIAVGMIVGGVALGVLGLLLAQ